MKQSLFGFCVCLLTVGVVATAVLDAHMQTLVAHVPASILTPQPLLQATTITPQSLTATPLLSVQATGVSEAEFNMRLTGLLYHMHWLVDKRLSAHTDAYVSDATLGDQVNRLERQLFHFMDEAAEDRTDLSETIATNGEFLSPTLTAATLAGTTTASSDLTIAGRLGVGTTSPSDTLAVNGAVYLANTTPTNAVSRLYNSAGDLYWNGSLVAGGAVGNWSSSGGDVYRLTGNVGIGTSSPVAKLDVNGNIIASGHIIAASELRGTALRTSESEFRFWDDQYSSAVSFGRWNQGMSISQVAAFAWTNANGSSLSNRDTYLYRDATGSIAQRNVANAQRFNIYNTYTNASNYERAVFDWQTTSNLLRIGTEAAGTGAVRDIALVGGNVGIGTTSPLAKLSVKGSGTGTGLLAQFTDSANSQKMVIRDDGKIVIDTSSYLSLTRYSDTTGSNIQMRRSRGTVDAPSNLLAGDVIGMFSVRGRMGPGADPYEGTVGSIQFVAEEDFASPDGGTYFVVKTSPLGAKSETEKLRITASGNVGIGTTGPGARLEVQDNSATVPMHVDGSTAASLIQYYANGVSKTYAGWTSLGSDGFGIYNSVGDTVNLLVTEDGNVGIGTTSPLAKLSVKGSGTGTGLLAQFTDSADSPKVTILDNGNVGIGTTSPTQELTLNGQLAFGSILGDTISLYGDRIGATNMYGFGIEANYAYSKSPIGFRWYTGVNADGGASDSMELTGGILTVDSLNLATLHVYGDNAAPAVFERTNSNGIEFELKNTTASTYFGMSSAENFGVGPNLDINNNPWLYIVRSTGNVGIGTTSPASLLHIEGADPTVTIRNDNVSQTGSLSFVTSTGGNFAGIEANSQSGEVRYDANSGYFPTFYANNSEIMRISTSGNVGIGTTSPLAKLSVKGSGTGTGLLAQFTDSANSPKVTILNNGNVGIGTTTPGYKLTVSGDVYASSFIDDGVTIGAPDYVFDDPAYDHLSIEDIETFIEENDHLPWLTPRGSGAMSLSARINEVLEALENLFLRFFELIGVVENNSAAIAEQNELIKAQNARIEQLETIIEDITGEEVLVPEVVEEEKKTAAEEDVANLENEREGTVTEKDDSDSEDEEGSEGEVEEGGGAASEASGQEGSDTSTTDEVVDEEQGDVEEGEGVGESDGAAEELAELVNPEEESAEEETVPEEVTEEVVTEPEVTSETDDTEEAVADTDSHTVSN